MECRILIEDLAEIVVCVFKSEVEEPLFRLINSNLVHRICYPMIAKTCVIVFNKIVKRSFGGIEITSVFCDTVSSCKCKSCLAVILHNPVTLFALKSGE